MERDDETKLHRSGKALSGRNKGKSGGKLKELNSELLAEVFTFLPSEDLTEVVLVSKHWERSAREGSGLCRRVTVTQNWEIESGGGGGHKYMCKILTGT